MHGCDEFLQEICRNQWTQSRSVEERKGKERNLSYSAHQFLSFKFEKVYEKIQRCFYQVSEQLSRMEQHSELFKGNLGRKRAYFQGIRSDHEQDCTCEKFF